MAATDSAQFRYALSYSINSLTKIFQGLANRSANGFSKTRNTLTYSTEETAHSIPGQHAEYDHHHQHHKRQGAHHRQAVWAAL